MLSTAQIRHFNQWDKEIKLTEDWFPVGKVPLTVAITSGASCPDTLVDEVILKINDYVGGTRAVEEALAEYQN
jgi:4-hydroxy-3-methylbut-2-enyl diphosphate reductase